MMNPARLLLVSSFVGLCIGAGCGDDGQSPTIEQRESPEPEQATRRGHQAGAATPHSPTPRPDALARVALGGERGRAFDAGAVIQAGTTAVALNLREGARVSVEPGGEVRLLDEAPAQIAIAQGLVHLVLAPMGSSPRPPLRVGTPSGTLLVNGSCDAWALVFPDGRAWFSVTGGMADVLVQGQEGIESVSLHGGQAIVAGADEPTAGPGSEEAARATAGVLLSSAPEGAPNEAALDELVAQLEVVIRSTREDYARGEALQDAHQAATQAGNGHDALQAIVRFSQETRGRREALLLVYERVRALALRLHVTPDPGAVHRLDVRAALRLSAENE